MPFRDLKNNQSIWTKKSKDPNLSPKDGGGNLVREIKGKIRQEKERKQADRAAQYLDLKERLQTIKSALVKKRRELDGIQEGFNDIVNTEGKGIEPEKLKIFFAPLEEKKARLEVGIKKDEQAINAIENNLLFVEFAKAESAAKAEEVRKQIVEQEARKKEEKLKKTENTMKNLDTIIREISLAIEAATEREKKIISLRAEREKLEDDKKVLGEVIEADVNNLLNALSEKRQKAIADALQEARKKGVSIYTSDIHFQESRSVLYRPLASTMSEWFAAWRDEVTPSAIPFLDRPLRALRAFEKDTQLERFRKLQEKIENLLNNERGLFADRKKINTDFIKKFLAPDSIFSATINRGSLRLLRDDETKEQTVKKKFAELDNLRKKMDVLLFDIGDNLYGQYRQSWFYNYSLDLEF